MIYGGSLVVPGRSVHDATSTLLGGLCRRLVQLAVCQVRSRINDVCHLAEVNVSI